MEVVKYTLKYKEEWDAFVAGSKNATFLFFRDYMEYHAHRFTDHSLLFYRKDKLVALLPANERGREITSHGGLTYGGLLTDVSMKVEVMLQVFEAMVLYFRQQGYTIIKYKTIPHIYHQSPAEEDLYALFRFNATLYRRDVLSVIEQNSLVKYNTMRKRRLKVASKFQWGVQRSFQFDVFVQLTEHLLEEKYNAGPVHSADEITKLAMLFPDSIKLFVASKAGELGAGIMIYETATVARCQYIATSEAGRAGGALDVLMHHLLTEVYPTKEYFDLGGSMDKLQQNGLNSTLLVNKESYGARAVVHDYYTIAL